MIGISEYISYYRNFAPILIIVTVVMVFLHTIIGNFSLLRAVYSCISLKNVITGKILKCFHSREGRTCDTTDVGYIYGWCNDTNNYGALPGNEAGPYGSDCNEWSWSKCSCPPMQCKDIEPGSESPNSPVSPAQRWGWCADAGVDRAMVGAPCGPKDGKCTNWIWNAKKCPNVCQRVSADGEDTCMCSAEEETSSSPWDSYLDKPVTISSRDKDKELYLNDAGFGTEKAQYTLQRKGTAYVIQNAQKCSLRPKREAGGHRDLGTAERMAQFVCGEDGDDAIMLEGDPKAFRVYSTIDNKKCGLQWSATDHIAKFDCVDEGDVMMIV